MRGYVLPPPLLVSSPFTHFLFPDSYSVSPLLVAMYSAVCFLKPTSSVLLCACTCRKAVLQSTMPPGKATRQYFTCYSRKRLMSTFVRRCVEIPKAVQHDYSYVHVRTIAYSVVYIYIYIHLHLPLLASLRYMACPCNIVACTLLPCSYRWWLHWSMHEQIPEQWARMPECVFTVLPIHYIHRMVPVHCMWPAKRATPRWWTL